MKQPDHIERQELSDGPFDEGSLLGIAAAPSIWALHFLVVYAMGAVACAKSQSPSAFMTTGATAVAVVAILAVSWPSFREWRRETDTETDHPSAEGRSHFLAHASLLLAGLSLFAVLLQTLPAWLSLSCR